jgi:ATP-dependent helicase/nuclease subunit B
VVIDDLRPDFSWVTPTRRLAHFLRRRFDEARAGQGLVVWRTPDVVTWQGLVERLFALERQAGRVAGRWLPDSAARLVWERIAQRDPATSGLVSPGQLGQSAYESWRRMHAYQIPPHAIAAGDTPETAAFARWAIEYAELLERHGWMDESRAVDRLDPDAHGAALEFIGFDALTPAQRSFLQRLERSGTVVRHRPAAEARGHLSWVECVDRMAECDAAARWAAHRLEQRPADRLAIVVPGLDAERDAVRRVVERVLVPAATLAGGPAPESKAYELAAARALSERPLAAAALEVLDAFAHMADLAVASRLLRSPFLSGAAVEADARARLDARIRRSEGPDLGLPRLARLAADHQCPDLARALTASLALTQQWPRRALPSRWSRLWFELLHAMGWPGTELDSDEHQARQRWAQLTAEFGACDDYVDAVSAGEAASLLRDMTQGTLFEPEELLAPVTIIDPATCAGMSFDGLWVAALDGARWPAAASPDPFLPRDWQARQRIPGTTAEVAAEDAQRLLDRLCRSASEVILSVPQFEGDAPLLPSALLGGIPRGELPDSWCARVPARLAFDARPQLESLVDAVMPPLEHGESARGGARLLEVQSACPFRAQAEFRLGARALEEPEIGVAASERGELVHGVLARIWSDTRDQRTLSKLSQDELSAMIRSAIAAQTAVAQRGAQGVMRHLLEIENEWLECRVAELLAADLERSPFAIEGVEEQRSISIGGMTLTLRIDRVDRLDDGSIAVIDYKTGSDAEPDAWLGERPRLPQLPLYAEALGMDRLSAVAFGRVRTGDTGFSGLTRDSAVFPGLKSPADRGWPGEYSSWEELLQAWRRRLGTLASEHVQGDARLAPDPSHACKYCHLAALCRIGETRLIAATGTAADD